MNYPFWKSHNKCRLLFIISLVLVFVLGIITVYHVKQKSALSNAKLANKNQTTVDVVTVNRADLIKRISLTGQTVPEAQVDIAAKYQGKVVAVNTELGQQVLPGQILVVQDTGDADISIRQNQAAYQQASADAATSSVSFQSSYDRAQADYGKAVADNQRYLSLYAQGAISREALDANQQALADAKASLDALVNQMNTGVPSSIESAQAAANKAQQSIYAMEKQRNDLALSAPRSGIIGYRQVEVGDIVSAGQKLLSIYDNSNIYVDCQVAEQDLGALNTGVSVDVQLESLGKTVPGKIIYISPGSDSQSLEFSLRIALINADPMVRTGMFAKAVIHTPLRQNTLVLPKNAVLEKNGQSYVFVINSNNTIEQRVVQVGARGDQDVELLSGIHEGEQVAVSNLARLHDGIVIIPNDVTRDSRGDGQ